MKYTEFLHTIETEITSRLDNDFKLTIHPVKKNNGMIYDGLVIINPKFNIAPTIYLNPYYHWYLDGVSIDSILDAILSTYNDFKPTEDFDISFCDDFSKVQDKIIFQLISYEKNQKQLKDIPYIKYLDFAIIFEVYVGAQLPEFGTITVTDALLSRWGIDTETLIRASMQNTPRILPCSIINMVEFLAKKCPGYASQMRAVCDFDSLPMYILTNSRQTNGASAVLYPGVLSSLSKKLGGNMLLIPSSIHEFLVMPLDSDIDVCNLSEFICEVNSTEVRDEEVLGERYYIYDSKTDTVY